MPQHASPPPLQIRLLGGFELVHDTIPATASITARLKSLLAYLVLHRDAPQARGHVAFLLWPDSTDGQARTNLRHLLHMLRQCLPDADRLLQIDSQHIQWHTDARVALDVAAFEDAAAAGALDEAVGVYGGDLLPGCYDEWVIAERERLRQMYVDVLWRRLRVQEDAGDHDAAVSSAQHLLQIEPLREDVYRALMRLHAHNGDRAAALQAYYTCADLLQQELDVAPSPATQDLYRDLLAAGGGHGSPPAGSGPEQSGSLAEVTTLLHRASDLLADFPEAARDVLLAGAVYESLGDVLDRMQCAAEARQAFDHALRWLPAGAHEARGRVRRKIDALRLPQ